MYCQNCGTQVQEAQRFCGQCGLAVAIAPLPPADNRVARHIRLMAILWMARGALNALGGFGILVFGHVFMPSLLERTERGAVGRPGAGRHQRLRLDHPGAGRRQRCRGAWAC